MRCYSYLVVDIANSYIYAYTRAGQNGDLSKAITLTMDSELRCGARSAVISQHDEIPTLGLTFGCLQLDGIDFPHEFQVVDDRMRMTTDGLLRCDFLLRYGAIMNFGQPNLTLATPYHLMSTTESIVIGAPPCKRTYSLPHIDTGAGKQQPDPSVADEVLVHTAAYLYEIRNGDRFRQ